MKTSVFFFLIIFSFSVVTAQEYDFENDYDAHIEYVDSIYQAGNDLIQEEHFYEGLLQVRSALDIYNQYVYVDHKVDKAVCYVTIAFCYLRLGDDENARLWLDRVGNSLGKERLWLETVAGLYSEIGEEQLSIKYSRKSEKCN